MRMSELPDPAWERLWQAMSDDAMKAAEQPKPGGLRLTGQWLTAPRLAALTGVTNSAVYFAYNRGRLERRELPHRRNQPRFEYRRRQP